MRHLQKLYWFTSRRSCSCQQCAQHPGCGHGGLPGVNANGIWFPNCWLPPKKGSHICVKERSKLILWIKKLTQKAFHQSDFSFWKKNMYFSEILFCVSALPEFIKQKREKKKVRMWQQSDWTLVGKCRQQRLFNYSGGTVQTLHETLAQHVTLLLTILLLVINFNMPWSGEL